MIKRIFAGICAGIAIVGLIAVSPAIRVGLNSWDFIGHKVDDATKYESLKKVEDTCRSMIASYESDKLTHEQYKDSEDKEKQSWAEQAKMRANKTASSYNNYILENSFLWSGNVPKDISKKLDYLA